MEGGATGIKDTMKKTKKEIIIDICNEQLEQLCRLEVDEEYLTAMTIAEPNMQQYNADLVKTKSALKHKRKLVEIIERQLVELDKKIN